ncbi:hypothetical protein H6504_04360 [Candidatus Woesearchaeota archaeon]|nr:hypothetical protein [Candidatus Woesearchaeota archaeon]
MSLEDKFYPDDGTLLTKFDNMMIKGAARIGDWYQSLTGKSYKELTNKSYRISSRIQTFCIYLGHPESYVLRNITKSFIDANDFKTPLEEQIELEANDLPKNSNQFGRTALTGVSIGLGFTMVPVFAAAFRDPDFLNLYFSTYSPVALAIAVQQFGLYLSRAHLPPPKIKTEVKVPIQFESYDPMNPRWF